MANKDKSPNLTRQSCFDVLVTTFEELEDRVAPRLIGNHNETLVHDELDAEIEELEEKTAPGVFLNHNETLVHDELA